MTRGPSFRYFVNACKTWLLTTQDKERDADRLFAGTDVQITTDGARYLGAALGSKEYLANFAQTKVESWSAEVVKLSTYAQGQPQLAYCALTQALSAKLSYGMRTVEKLSTGVEPLEAVLRERLISSITGNAPPSGDTREHFSGPSK